MTSVEETASVRNAQVVSSVTHEVEQECSETSLTLDFLTKQLNHCGHCGASISLLPCRQERVDRSTVLHTPCVKCGVVNALICSTQVFPIPDVAKVTYIDSDQTLKIPMQLQHPSPQDIIVYPSTGDPVHVMRETDPQNKRTANMTSPSTSVDNGSNTDPCTQLIKQAPSIDTDDRPDITEVLDILTKMNAGVRRDLAPASVGVDTDDLIDAYNINDNLGETTTELQNPAELKNDDRVSTKGTVYNNEHSYYTVRRMNRKQGSKDEGNNHLVMQVLPDGSITLLKKVEEDNRNIEGKVTYILQNPTEECGLDMDAEPIPNPENPNSTGHTVESESSEQENKSDLDNPTIVLSRSGEINEKGSPKPNNISQVKMAKIQDISFDPVGNDQTSSIRLGKPEVLLIVQAPDQSSDDSAASKKSEQNQAIATPGLVQIALKQVAPHVMSAEALKHEEGNRISNKFQCDICNMIFQSHLPLEKHYSSHINSKCYACKKCGKLFLTVTSRASHHLSHRQEPLSCNICGEVFELRKHLTMHQRKHTKEKMYFCNVCTKGFVTNYEMNQHRRTHFDARDYRCPVCGNAFKTRPALRKHSRNHLAEKPFVCEVCKREFKHSYVYKEHQRTHTGEKPYQCELCGQTFVSGSNAARHIKHVHKDALPVIVKTVHPNNLCLYKLT